MIRLYLIAIPALTLTGCASTIDCCSEFGIDAGALLGSSGRDCGLVRNDPRPSRTRPLACVRRAQLERRPFLYRYVEIIPPDVGVLTTVLIASSGERILMQQGNVNDEALMVLARCNVLTVDLEGKVAASGCAARDPPAAD